MDLVLIFGVVFVVGIVLGWLGATHVHSIAKATTAATTVSNTDAAALNAKIDGLGTSVQKILDHVGQAAVAAATSAAQPKA